MLLVSDWLQIAMRVLEGVCTDVRRRSETSWKNVKNRVMSVRMSIQY